MEEKYQPILSTSAEEQIKRRIRELDSSLTDELTEFPQVLKNEFGENSLESIKYPNLHIVNELDSKVRNVYEEAQKSARHCEKMCKAIQKDMKKKTQIEKMIKLAEYIKTIKELEEIFDQGDFLNDLDALGRDNSDPLNAQIEEMDKIDSFRKIREIEIEEKDLLQETNLFKSYNLEQKGCSILEDKASERFKSKFDYYRSSYGVKRIAINSAWISLIKFYMNEFCITGTKISKCFSLESCTKFKGYLLNSISEYESIVLEDYKQDSKIQQMMIYSNSENIADEKLKSLDLLCEDICSISHYSQTFMFVLHFCGTLHANNRQTKDVRAHAVDTIEYTKKGEDKHSLIIQEIIGYYITFEKPLLQNMLRKVLEEDDKTIIHDIKSKYDKEKIIQRDLPDEVFFVYQKCAIRAIYTLNMSTACAIVNVILSSLNEDVFEYLNTKISMFISKSKKVNEIPKLFSLAFSNNDESQRAGFSAKYTLYNACLIAYLNTYQTCIEYIEKLKQKLVSELDTLLEETECSLEEFKLNFNSSLEAEEYFQKDMFNTSLDFCSETIKQFNYEIEEKLSFLHSPDFSEVVNNLLKELAKLDLNLDDKKYDEYDADDPFFHNFCNAITKIISQWSSQLMQELFEKFVKNFTAYVAKMFLKTSLLSSPQKLSFYGALYLDKLVRSMVNFFQFLTKKPIRNEFEKPLEAVQVLCFESNEELENYLDDLDDGNKKLTKEEVNLLIFRRTDAHIFKCLQ
ncbi:unnamed protein product [Moneuplotes crassus]|uniref:Uncharacterized protein n=1 Tax=Euplotes crassus TaxID=5936 RepID=A0AAD1U2F6_EUPCR|nr:unnamed protein product [Moneuplotes crassus]